MRPLKHFPFEPLRLAISSTYDVPVHSDRCPCTDRLPGERLDAITCVSYSAVSEVTGAASRQVNRWVNDGLTLLWADRAALRIGMHPAEIWPQQWRAIEEAETAAPA